MAANNIFDNLLALPLFLGMTKTDLQKAAGLTRFDFRKVAEGEVIVEKGEACKHIYFLIDGDIIVRTLSEDGEYTIEEDIYAPEIFQPEFIFGLHQHFTHTYIAKHNCSLLCIDKQEVLKLASIFEIFRINLLNWVCTKSQKLNKYIKRTPPHTLKQRIVRFFEINCLRPSGEKVFYIKMNRLADELNDSRINISKALNQLEEDGLLYLYRARINIPSLEKLIEKGNK